MRAIRLERIMSILKQRGYATVEELAKELGVSEITVRRDLDILQGQGLVERKRGGAVLKSFSYEVPFFLKLERRKEQKIRIAKKAASLLENDWTVFMMGGTTVYYMAQALDDSQVHDLTIITNSITTAWAVINLHKSYELIHTGGMVRPGSFECVGEEVVEKIGYMNFDLLIMGADGVDAVEGVTIANHSESVIARKAAERAKRIMVLADSEKMGIVKAYRALSLKELDVLITDDGVDPDFVSKIPPSLRLYSV